MQVFEERAYLVGIERKNTGARSAFGISESLEELAQLADTAGLTVVGTTYQKYVVLVYPSKLILAVFGIISINSQMRVGFHSL